MPDNSGSQNKKSVNKGFIAVIVVALVVIIALLGAIVFLLNSKKDDENKERRSVVVTEDNAAEVISNMLEEDASSSIATNVAYYSATMNYEWRFPTGDSESSNAYVENNTDNTNDVYFDLFLADDENNAIYESPIIPVGGSLSNFSLSKNLDAGAYDCICVYHLVDENQETLSTLRVTVTVIVEQ